jgi:hypothetical protein
VYIVPCGVDDLESELGQRLAVFRMLHPSPICVDGVVQRVGRDADGVSVPRFSDQYALGFQWSHRDR